jgi:hypothetical protein
MDAPDEPTAFIVNEAVALGYRFPIDGDDLICEYPRPVPGREIATQFSRVFSDNKPAIVRYIAKRIAEARQ